MAAPLAVPAGWLLAAPNKLVSCKALIGQSVLFRWPDEGWVRGKVARVSWAAGLVAYGSQPALGSLDVVSLLSAAAARCGLSRTDRATGTASPSVGCFT